MATQKQIEANRRNARKSTGPKTAAGKAASAANALSHGLTAAGDVLLADESADAFEARQRDVLADLAPQDALQAMLARRIVQLLWRLDRAARLEAELFLHGELAAKRDRLRAPGPSGAHRAAIERVYGDKDGKCPEALSKALDERDRALEERRRAILAVDAEILLGAPTAQILVEREASARAFDRLVALRGDAAALAQPDAGRVPQPEAGGCRAGARASGRGGGGGGAAGPGGRKGFLQNEANPAHASDAPPSRSARPSAGGVGETPWYDHEKGFLQNEANSAQPTERADDPVPLTIPMEAPPIL